MAILMEIEYKKIEMKGVAAPECAMELPTWLRTWHHYLDISWFRSSARVLTFRSSMNRICLVSMYWFKGTFTGKPQIFNGKFYGFRLRFSQQNQSIFIVSAAWCRIRRGELPTTLAIQSSLLALLVSHGKNTVSRIIIFNLPILKIGFKRSNYFFTEWRHYEQPGFYHLAVGQTEIL